MRTAIYAKYVVPLDTAEIISDGVVAFEDSRITYVGPKSGFDPDAFGPDKTLHAPNRAVLPGLVNTHIHLVGAYIKALTEDVPGNGDSAGLWTRAVPTVFQLETSEFYWAAATHGMEMLLTGTTTINSTWQDERFLAPAVRDLGMRAVMSEMIFGTDMMKLNAKTLDRPWDAALAARGLDNAVELFETWHGKEDGRITTRISPAGPGYCSADLLEACRDLAHYQGVGINIHIAEVPGETEFVMKEYGLRPVELGHRLGLMTPQTVGFHCVYLSDSDIDIFAGTGAHLSHTSYHVAKRGYFPPMEKVYAKGVEVSFGSDWCSNDLWKFMRFGILYPRVKTGDVGMLNGYDALRMATLGGAKALGLDHEIGSLEVGKKADLILVDIDTPWCRPIYTPNLHSNLVYNANGGDVTDVFIDGREIVRDREILTVDRPEILKETQRQAERVWARALSRWS